MVLTRPFQCPTRVHANQGYVQSLRELVGGRTWTLVTSQGWRGRGVVGELASALGEPASTIDTVPANPTVSYIETLAEVPPSCVDNSQRTKSLSRSWHAADSPEMPPPAIR